MSRSHRRILPPEAAGAICLQLKELIGAGVPAEEAFAILGEDARDQRESALYDGIAGALREGSALSGALEQAEVFPAYMTGMVRIGERTGAMEDVLSALAEYFSREAALRDSVRGAVVFPLLMGGLMAVLLGVLLAFVLPVFSSVFASIGLALSPSAAWLAVAGQGVALGAAVLLACLLLIGALLWFDKRTGKLGLLRRTKLSRETSAGRFASAMALMLHSGLPLDESLRRAGELSHTASAVRAAERVMDGASLSEALAGTGLFSGFYLRMLRVGEHAGRAEQMMEEVASRMSASASAHADELIARIEPTIVTVLALAAGLVLLSVMLPLLGAMTAFG
ncbi:type II secretion system F family protein [Agathobaculum sp.]|uniref:type II secretion system F family protein n=1 Tax=Agathobaculum sp. TaxID=2048138 RepID=UPI002A82D718|nr:type II secretion system F family protein [Agathobaculum sp.]MDY3617818.1 type II secretion system F family protein [Agathobaculum sp.]